MQKLVAVVAVVMGVEVRRPIVVEAENLMAVEDKWV
jgi:hypothetical protein